MRKILFHIGAVFAATAIVSVINPSLVSAQNLQTTNSPNIVTLGRKVQAVSYNNPLFSAAIVTRSNINLNGNNVTVDSFDSGNPLYNINGQYSPLFREAGGDVATDSSVVGDVSLGNANIYGHLYTGPGTASSSVQVGPNGAVGNMLWNTTSSGIQPGYWSGDFNFNIPDVPAPPTGTTALPAPSNGTVILTNGNFTISPTDPNIGVPILVISNVVLWVQGSYSPTSITVSNNGVANLALFVGQTTGSGDSLTIGGNTAINQPGLARTLQLYGMPSLTSITLAGNVGYVGTIYAPEANATFSGGGNNTDVSGAIVVNSLTMNGHFSVHYDQNLASKGPSRGWVAKSWLEQRYP